MDEEFYNIEKIKVPELVDIISTEVPSQKVFINGQEQILTQKVLALACPKCKQVLMPFNQNVSILQVNLELADNFTSYEENIKYCPKCGCELRFNKEIVEEV